MQKSPAGEAEAKLLPALCQKRPIGGFPHLAGYKSTEQGLVRWQS